MIRWCDVCRTRAFGVPLEDTGLFSWCAECHYQDYPQRLLLGAGQRREFNTVDLRALRQERKENRFKRFSAEVRSKFPADQQ